MRKYIRWGVMLLALFCVTTTVFMNKSGLSIKNMNASTSSGIGVLEIVADGEHWGTGNIYALGNDHVLYYGSAKSALKPVTDVNNKLMSNIKHIYSSVTGYGISTKPGFMAQTMDGSIYVWGNNTSGKLGNGSDKDIAKPTIIDDYLPTKDIADIKMINAQTFIITSQNEVYASGDNSKGILASGDTVSSKLFIKSKLSDIHVKDFTIASYGSSASGLALDQNGMVYSWGDNAVTQGAGILTEPTQLKGDSDQLFTVKIKSIIQNLGNYTTSYGFHLFDENNVMYDVGASGGVFNVNQYTYANDPRYKKYTYPTVNSVITLPQNANIQGFADMHMNLVGIVDGVVYGKCESNTYGNGLIKASGGAAGFVDMGLNFIEEGDKPIFVRSYGSYFYVVTENNKAYVSVNGGTAIEITCVPPVQITAKKTINQTQYISNEKYNGDIRITVNKDESAYAGVNLMFKSCDADGLNCSNESIVTSGSYDNTIALQEGEHYNKIYEFYIDGKKNDTLTKFHVNLYKHMFDSSKLNVKTGDILPLDSVITWEENNGLEGNTTIATLTKPDGTIVTYTAGSKLSAEGAYSLHIQDDYGNEITIAFEIVDVPLPKSMSFTSTSSPLVYKDANTTAGGTVGELSLAYDVGKTPSKIKTIAISEGNDAGYFDEALHIDPTTKKVTLLAKTDIPAGTYHLKFTGTDENNITFTDFPVAITVTKANNPMDWNANTKKLISEGMYYGDSHTLGIDHPSEITVTYKQTSNNPLVDVSQSGVITVSGMNADTMNITVEAIPSGTTNYDLTSKTATITITKRTLSLKTVIGTTQKDYDEITLADDLPSFDVISTAQLPNGITLPTPVSFSLYDQSGKEITMLNKAGTYEIRANFATGALDEYKVTWGYAELKVKDVIIDNGNASSYYDLILEDGKNTPYVAGTWTNKTIKVVPKHKNFHLLGIDGAEPSAGTKEYTTEGDNSITLVFKNDAGARISTTIDHVMYDQTAPVMTGFTYKDTTSTFSNFLRAITFNQFFAKEQTATFVGTDVAGSGIETYSYTLNKVNDDGGFLSELSSGLGASVHLPVNANYELIVIAIDYAGNESAKYTEYVKIDDNVPELHAKAAYTDTGDDYDGSWTTKGITITLSCAKELKQYEYSTDGITYTPMNSDTLTIPNTTNINDVAYLFRGTTLTGMKTTASVIVKIDQETPEMEVTATSNGSDYSSGDIAEHDITLNLKNKTNNISGTIYYYTTDSTISLSDPTASDTKWKQATNPITVSDNGMATYYFKAVSKAGLVSPLISFDTDVRKRDYTNVSVAATSNGSAYKSGWTKHDVIFTISGGLLDASLITGYEYCITDGTAPTNTDTWFPISAGHDGYQLIVDNDMEKKSFWFRVDEDGVVSDPFEVNIDKTAPMITAITYTEKTRNTFETMMRSLSFHHMFKEAQTASFEGNDIGGSGIKDYQYTLSMIDDTFHIINAGAKKTGFSVNLAKDQNYKLEVIAIDNAGNESGSYVEYIKINEKIGEFDLNAKTAISQISYIGEWTSEAIDITMSSVDDIVEYAFSLDGTSYTVLSTPEYTIDNTTSRDGEIFYFRSTNAKGDIMVKQITANIDVDTPEVEITATSGGLEYLTGSLTNQDVILSFANPIANVSGQTFYYTKDATVAGKDPNDVSSGWVKCSSSTMSLVKNETATYYVVAVSGAGLTSSVASFDVDIQKKTYTKPVVKATTEGKLYTSGMWAKEDILVELTGGIADSSLIQAYEYTITDGTVPSGASTWITIPAVDHKATFTISDETKSAVYWFKAKGAGLDKLSNPLKVRLDLTKPVVDKIKLTYKNADGLSKFLNMITLGAYFNQEIEAEVVISDNLSESQDMEIEVQEVQDGKAGNWTSYTNTLHYGDGSNLIIKARVSDAAGNMSEVKESDHILLDLSEPTIQGVKDGAVYHLPRYVTYQDSVSGIDPDTTMYKDGAGDHTLHSPATFKGIGKVQLHIQDMAENITKVSFEIVALPVLDELTDSDEDRKLISDIVKEYDEVKEHMNEQEQKAFEEWLNNAKEKTKRYVSQVKEAVTNIIVSGLDDTKFEEEVELIVQIVTSEIKVEEIKLEEVEGLSEQTEVKEAYDIYLKKGEDIIQVPEDGSVKVMIPYTKERKLIKNLKVVYIDDERQVIIYPHEIETIHSQQYITFVTTHFSHYALVGEIDKKVEEPIFNDNELNKDVDGDGIPDINITEPGKNRPYLNIDTDHDSRPDVNVDLNGDMEADINIDATGDFIPDVDIDSDGDGKPEINLDVNGDGVADQKVVSIAAWNPNFDVEEPIKYDTMKDIVYKEEPNTQNSSDTGTNVGSSNVGQSNAQNSKPSVQGSYVTNSGGASTGDTIGIQSIFLWIMTLFTGGCSVMMLRKKR